MAVTAGSARAQILFDWPLRTAPEPEAVLTGAPALPWNPAGGANASSELWIMDTEGAEATDLDGLAAAVTRPLPWRLGTVGLFFQHVGIDDIPRTGDSPEPLPGDLDVGESVLGVSLARHLTGTLAVGGGVRYARAGVSDDVDDRLSGDLGLQLRPVVGTWSPTVGLSLVDLGGDERILGAVAVPVPRRWTGALRLGLGYGFDRTTRGRTLVDQRASLRITWLESVHGGVGLTFADEDDEVTPLWMVGVDLGRYSLGVLRERLLGGFGSANFYQLTVRLP